MYFDLDQLRSQLRDVPLTSSFFRSVELLEDAFDYSQRADGRSSWGDYRFGDDAAFFGEQTLRSLLGREFREQMASRSDWQSSNGQGEPNHTLRKHIQRYVVVGYRDADRAARAACVLFHGGNISLYDGADGAPTVSVAALELVRVRLGLMNRRQAHLLVNHLNRFRRNQHHGEALSWVVKRGPAADTSARAWLNLVAGERQYLQHTVGELPSWGLGANAARGLAMYALEPKAVAHPDQVFSYGRARCLLPSRYAIYAANQAGDIDTPDGAVWCVVRKTECSEARRTAEKAGLIVRPFDFKYVEPEDMWGADDLLPPGDGPGYSPEPAEVYATSFSREEALRAMRVLRKNGYRSISAARVGADGSYVRWESGNSYFYHDEVRLARELLVDGEPAFDVRLFTYFVDFENR
jgi:hypothetical protein